MDNLKPESDKNIDNGDTKASKILVISEHVDFTKLEEAKKELFKILEEPSEYTLLRDEDRAKLEVTADLLEQRKQNISKPLVFLYDRDEQKNVISINEKEMEDFMGLSNNGKENILIDFNQRGGTSMTEAWEEVSNAAITKKSGETPKTIFITDGEPDKDAQALFVKQSEERAQTQVNLNEKINSIRANLLIDDVPGSMVDMKPKNKV